jgi:pantoate--beta-alanine ligase
MKIVSQVRDFARPRAFVPTMGALHTGHQSLIQLARQYCDEVIVSVFVNPLQFEDKADLAKYPKTPEIDAELASATGATYLWRPEVSLIYPGSELKLRAGELGGRYEGASRPGHFDGVLTVVNRLFELVRPQYAIFGEKDLQQLFLIQKMAAELHPAIEIIAAPTVRTEAGLALSSRNIRLSDSGQLAAAAISRALRRAAQLSEPTQMRQALSEVTNEPAFKLDYAEIIDRETFEPADANTRQPHAIIAGWIEGVRLIDNMAMQSALVRS